MIDEAPPAPCPETLCRSFVGVRNTSSLPSDSPIKSRFVLYTYHDGFDIIRVHPSFEKANNDRRNGRDQRLNSDVKAKDPTRISAIH
jgi:hypothetical protein